MSVNETTQMEEQAQELAQLVGTFRLSNNDRASGEGASLLAPARSAAPTARKSVQAPKALVAGKALPAKASKSDSGEWEEF